MDVPLSFEFGVEWIWIQFSGVGWNWGWKSAPWRPLLALLCSTLPGAALPSTARHCPALHKPAQSRSCPVLLTMPGLTQPCPALDLARTCLAQPGPPSPVWPSPVFNDPMQHKVQMTCCSKIKSIFHSALSISSICNYSEVISLQNMLQKNVLADPGGTFRTAPPPPPKKKIQCGLFGLKNYRCEFLQL